MNWILMSILILLIIWISVLVRNLTNATKGFGLLLEKFVEVNQEFYESQKNIYKKDKEIFDGLIKQTAEISIIRKYSTQISLALKTISEVIKSLKETQKEIKVNSDELKVSKDIAGSLANVSNNIGLLDKIAVDLKRAINELERKNKNAK